MYIFIWIHRWFYYTFINTPFTKGFTLLLLQQILTSAPPPLWSCYNGITIYLRHATYSGTSSPAAPHWQQVAVKNIPVVA